LGKSILLAPHRAGCVPQKAGTKDEAESSRNILRGRRPVNLQRVAVTKPGCKGKSMKAWSWGLAHLYAFCKGGDYEVGHHSFFFAEASKLAPCLNIPGAITERRNFISSLAVVISGKRGWLARSGAICF
jgi:hypothetical protein